VQGACQKPAARPAFRARLADSADAVSSLSSLQTGAFVLYGPPRTGLYDEIVRACAAAGSVQTIGQHAPRTASTPGLVAAGVGVGPVPAPLRHVTVGGVARRRLPASADAKVALGPASRRHHPSAVVRNFVRLVKLEADRPACATRFMSEGRQHCQGRQDRQTTPVAGARPAVKPAPEPARFRFELWSRSSLNRGQFR
jgi:LysR substrate binding domain